MHNLFGANADLCFRKETMYIQRNDKINNTDVAASACLLPISALEFNRDFIFICGVLAWQRTVQRRRLEQLKITRIVAIIIKYFYFAIFLVSNHLSDEIITFSSDAK